MVGINFVCVQSFQHIYFIEGNQDWKGVHQSNQVWEKLNYVEQVSLKTASICPSADTNSITNLK